MNTNPYFFCRTAGRYTRIPLSEIRYIEASRNYCRINLPGCQLTVLATLQQLEKSLAPHGLVRIHRGFLVSLAHVTAFDRQTVRLEGGQLPIGESYYQNLRNHVAVLGDAATRPPAKKAPVVIR